MYKRKLQKPTGSIILFGPRGTGKSTWVEQHFRGAAYYDLLNSREVLRLERRPDLLFDEQKHLAPGSWVIVDEVQKVPALMDEVHRLIEKQQLRFVLCGSSARKLKRAGGNLLAGRAIVTHMFPLTYGELGSDHEAERALTHGTLPLSVTGTDAEGYLATYVDTYLNEEIRAEALTRNVGAFSRFLEVAARQNSQVTNVANIAREAAVGRSTVQNYFDILADTLIGYWLPAWKLKRATKQVTHPKFYLFDTGVARALSGRLPYPPTQEELGPLIETLVVNEVKAYLAYRNLRYKLSFWRNYDGAEVDLLCETRTGYVAVEIKAARDWQRRFSRGLNILRESLQPGSTRTYGVFRGDRRVDVDGIPVLPLTDFLAELWKGAILS